MKKSALETWGWYLGIDQAEQVWGKDWPCGYYNWKSSIFWKPNNRKECGEKKRVWDSISWGCLYLWSWRRRQGNQRDMAYKAVVWVSVSPPLPDLAVSASQQEPVPHRHLLSPCPEHLVTAEGGPLARLMSFQGSLPSQATLPIHMPLGMDSECPVTRWRTPCFWVWEAEEEREFWPASLLLSSWTG